MIDAYTSLYGILGHPVRHSFSPYIHNTGFKIRDINAVYTAWDVQEQDLGAAVKGLKALGIQGASVTIPHKVTVMPHLDELDEIARLVGSVNLIYRKDEKLMGTNTDAWGFFQALEKVAPIHGSKISVFGSGGAARAVCFALFYYAQPASLTIYARSQDKEESLRLQDHLRQQLASIQKLNNPQIIQARDRDRWPGAADDSDIIINTTPMGMHPLEDLSPLSQEEIPEGITAMDVVYTPRDTLFLKNAAARKCNLGYGIDMLLYQGLKQFEIWTGQSAPEQEMRTVLYERLGMK